MRKKGKWFEGDIFSLKIGADKSKRLVEKYGKGVMKPQALETKKRRGKSYSRVYYKPIQSNEFWD
jgi:hypothetical protein